MKLNFESGLFWSTMCVVPAAGLYFGIRDHSWGEGIGAFLGVELLIGLYLVLRTRRWSR